MSIVNFEINPRPVVRAVAVSLSFFLKLWIAACLAKKASERIA